MSQGNARGEAPAFPGQEIAMEAGGAEPRIVSAPSEKAKELQRLVAAFTKAHDEADADCNNETLRAECRYQLANLTDFIVHEQEYLAGLAELEAERDAAREKLSDSHVALAKIATERGLGRHDGSAQEVLIESKRVASDLLQRHDGDEWCEVEEDASAPTEAPEPKTQSTVSETQIDSSTRALRPMTARPAPTDTGDAEQ